MQNSTMVLNQVTPTSSVGASKIYDYSKIEKSVRKEMPDPLYLQSNSYNKSELLKRYTRFFVDKNWIKTLKREELEEHVDAIESIMLEMRTSLLQKRNQYWAVLIQEKNRLIESKLDAHGFKFAHQDGKMIAYKFPNRVRMYQRNDFYPMYMPFGIDFHFQQYHPFMDVFEFYSNIDILQSYQKAYDEFETAHNCKIADFPHFQEIESIFETLHEINQQIELERQKMNIPAWLDFSFYSVN